MSKTLPTTPAAELPGDASEAEEVAPAANSVAIEPTSAIVAAATRPARQATAPKKPRIRLRYLFVGALCVAALMVAGRRWLAERDLREERAVAKLRQLEGEPLYETDAGLSWTPPKPGPLGTPTYRLMVRFGVSVDYRRPFVVSADLPKLIPLLSDLPRLHSVIFERCDLERADLDTLHRALPGVTISYCRGRPSDPDAEVVIIKP